MISARGSVPGIVFKKMKMISARHEIDALYSNISNDQCQASCNCLALIISMPGTDHFALLVLSGAYVRCVISKV